MVRKLLALRRAEWRPLAAAWAVLWLIDLELRFMSFRRVLEGADRLSDATAAVPPDVPRARAYARLVDVAARHHVVRARCLHRSLALHRTLRAEGMASVLRVGVHKNNEDLVAHAWVELAGQVVNDRPEAVASFVALSGTSSASTLAGSSMRSASWR